MAERYAYVNFWAEYREFLRNLGFRDQTVAIIVAIAIREFQASRVQ